MAQGNQEFEELQRVYSWLNDDYMAALQALYPTWSQLSEANRLDLVQILSEIPVPPESPHIYSRKCTGYSNVCKRKNQT